MTTTAIDLLDAAIARAKTLGLNPARMESVQTAGRLADEAMQPDAHPDLRAYAEGVVFTEACDVERMTEQEIARRGANRW